MNRIVLALLALFAGIVAPVAPASARIGASGKAEVGAVERVELVSRACAVAAAVAEQPACRAERRGKGTAKVRTTRARVLIPAILLGSDRALE